MYETLLGELAGRLGDQPSDVLASAAEEVLAVLKGGAAGGPAACKGQVEALLGTAYSPEDFNKLVNMSKRITDFGQGDGEGAAASTGAGGDAIVVLADDDEEEDAGTGMHFAVVEEEDDEAADDEGEEADAGRELAGGGSAEDEGGADGEEDEAGLPVKDIDAFWLQRQMATYYADAADARAKAAAVMQALQQEDMRAAEQALVLELDYDKFDFIKLLLNNRRKIVWVTSWRRADSDADRAELESAMLGDASGEGPRILAKLKGTGAAVATGTLPGGRVDTLDRRRQGGVGGKARVGREGGSSGGAAAGGGAGGPTVSASLLDLESLKFKAGARTMTNGDVSLPEGAWRSTKPGYEEVHVPAKAAPAPKAGELFPISSLPAWTHAAFKGMTTLNRVQSRLRPCAFERDENLLLCAPTGAGKTNVAVLTILQAMGAWRDAETGVFDKASFKIVYIAPMKALVQEVVANLTQRIGEPYGLNVRELSGDVNLSKAEIADTQIIVSTPEKWDVVTRKAGDRLFTQLVRCVIIDEIHLLHDDRGPVLECLVARTRRQEATTKEHVRLVGLSATLPNYEDVATFLGVDPASGLFFFDGSFRPCPLQQQYIGVTERKPLKRLQVMNDITYEKVLQQAGKNQVLVFVHTRKDTAATARFLRDTALERDELSRFLREDSASREILIEEADSDAVTSEDLRNVLPHGFAMHNAGMTRAERTLVEELFADGHVQVLVSTATLAWGVNLPAHAVIIKGTQIYNPEAGCWLELSPQDVMQMLGRAGRPQYDTFGEGIIITQHAQLPYYLSLMTQQLPIESQMVSRLPDCLNAEIVAGNVGTLADAATWLTYSYLYWRMLQSPQLYGLPVDAVDADPTLHQRRLDLAHSACVLLDKHNLIRYDRRGGVIQPTPLGKVASHYYVVHPTIAAFNQYLKPHMSEIELFRVFSLAHEFRNIVIRQAEREELRKVLERVPVPVKEGVEEPTAKVNALLQAYISRLPLDGYALNADMVYIRGSAGRLVRAMFEICLKRGWAALAKRTLDLSNMIQHRQWRASTPLRQFTPGLPEELLRSIEKKDLDWERYWDLTSVELGELVRLPSVGKVMHRLVHSFPRLELAAHVQPITRSTLRVDLTLVPDFTWDERYHGGALAFWVLVEDADSAVILHAQPWFLQRRYAGEEHVVTFTVPLTDPMPPQYFVRVLADRWLGCSAALPISFRHLILPAKYPPTTELLDLEPMPLSALRSAEGQAVLSTAARGGLHGSAGDSVITSTFNAIQTQAFPAVYESDENVLVAGPAGSGLLSLLELALIRLYNDRPDATAVYIGANARRVAEVFRLWDFKFGKGLGKGVVELTGDAVADNKLLGRSHLALATPEAWDRLSRMWQKRKAVTAVALFLVEDLHMLASPEGAVLEVVVSRMRYVAARLPEDARPRIVATAASIANAVDVGGWLGARPGRSIFNFHPKVRPTPLDIDITGMDIPDFASRLLAMARPVFATVSAHCAQAPGADFPALLMAPSRKQAVLSAIDAVTFAAADGDATRFIPSGSTSDGRGEALAALARAAEEVQAQDPSLAACLKGGVAFLHDGMPEAHQAKVRALWSERRLGVVAMEASGAWGCPLRAHLVVVLGTQRYDGATHRYVDYPITDLVQMMQLATVPGASGNARVAIFAASHRRQYLKKFLFEPLPVESHLDARLHDHLNAEVVSGMVETKQDAVDWMTWTLYYRRLNQNPNFYALTGTTPEHLSHHLSELVESTLADLEASGCVEIEDEMDLLPLNLGMIAAYYYLTYTTLEVFASSVKAESRLKGFLDILSHAAEFEAVPVRHGEEATIRSLARHAKVALSATTAAGGSMYTDPHVKTNMLLQAHFSRKRLPSNLMVDTAAILPQTIPLLQALVDVVALSGWIKPALACMELTQMVVQGVWITQPGAELLQIPHFTPALAKRALEWGAQGGSDEEEGGIESVLDLMEMEGPQRLQLLEGLAPAQLADVAAFCNRYPQVDLAFTATSGGDGTVGGSAAEEDTPVTASVTTADTVSLRVELTRESTTEGMDEGAGLGSVIAPRYPKAKTESWWVVLGNLPANKLYAIKRVAFGAKQSVKLAFPAPASPGKHELTLYLMCDSYLGCDQEYDFHLTVEEGPDSADEGDDAELA